MCKIAYLNIISNLKTLSGVHTKVLNQQKACGKANLPIDFHIFTESDIASNDSITYHTLPHQTSTAKKLNLEARSTVDRLAEYDVVISRAYVFSPFFIAAFFNRPFKLISEFHTLNFTLFKLREKKVYYMERLCARPSLALTDGAICLTNEIAQDTLQAGFSAKREMRTITNGVELNAIPMTGCRPFDGNEVNIAFVGSMDTAWHGLSRMIESLHAYKGNTHVNLHLIGSISPSSYDCEVGNNVSIEYHGVQTGAALDETMSHMHVGMGTLALYRKGMDEACTLKVREYMARGLPFIYAYDDPDVPEDFPYALKLPNDGSLISIPKILDFLNRIRLDKEASAVMREHCKQYMAWENKMSQYHQLAMKVATGR
ncbi:glycosyltransferase [uncultured Pseudodesulfovibrio sp.]|uniref:glycosyltransferase n=1 Tax=uncultured Pseudodesulfovibrio sp. TaxID=2035858 RepID=UPI0029C66A57|nr:glycosyltransferase [uncultured Pseudodesulfovibrio sp.]